MTTERMQRTYELFEQALERPPEQRSAFLVEACGDDAELRAEVDSLLEHDGQATDGFMQLPEHVPGVALPARPGQAAQPHEASSAHRPPGPLIEGYEIIKKLHRGGQGAVYQAIQKSTKRTVALKLLLEGPYASPRQRHRFEREIDLVAGLQHPHIVTVYDSGVTRDDRHYFAMEYIHGQSLNVYLSDKDFSIDETLRLFQKICAAVNYAHQRGVIHRDLKPGNIRIDANGEPHILDFGLAKAAGAGLTDGLPVSVTGEFMGTLAYASPEQTKGDPNLIDIRTDVYSLGVILYEMLTGKYPYPVVGQMAEVFRNIAEAEPMKPSTIRRQINDEVETIVLKALAKEKERRYQSAENLARDVEHYLGGEPIDAKRDSAWYVIRKSLRRYRLKVAVAAAFVLLLGGFTIALSIMYQNQSRARQEAELARTSEEEQRKLAEQRADELEAVTEFQGSMLSDIDAEQMGGTIVAYQRERIIEGLEADEESPERIEAAIASFDELAALVNPTNLALKVVDEHVLSRAVETIERKFADQPAVRAALQQTVADTYREIGLYEPAMPLQQAALRNRREELGDEHPDTLRSISTMGGLLLRMGRFEDAMPHLTEALERRRRVLGDDHADTLNSIDSMGVLLLRMGRFEDAMPYLTEALERRRRVLGDDHADTLNSMNKMGALLASMGKYEEARPHYRTALEKRRRVLGDDHPDTLNSITNMGGLLGRMGRHKEAEPYFREALEHKRRVLGDDHPNTIGSMGNLGVLLSEMKRFDEAEPYCREALERSRRTRGNDHPGTLRLISSLGALCEAMGDFAAAEAYDREALDGRRRMLGADHPSTLISIGNIGFLYQRMGRYEEAERYYRDALERRRRVLGEDRPDTLTSMNNLGHLLRLVGRYEEAEPYSRDALEGRRRVLGDDHPNTLLSLHNRAELLIATERFAEAEALALESHDRCVKRYEPEHAKIGEAIDLVVRLYTAWHEAEPNKGYDAKAAMWRAKLE